MDRLPTGGLPLGYSMMKGQIPFHDGFPLTYSVPQKNDEDVTKTISLKDALAFVTPEDVLSYYKGVQDDVFNAATGDSHVLRRAKQGETKARITLAAISAFEQAVDFSEWVQGNGHVSSPEYRSYLILGMMFVFKRLGYLPHDESSETQPVWVTSNLLKQVNDGDVPSGRWRKVWCYAKDFSGLSPSSSETSHAVRYETVFCRGFSICYATGSPRNGTEKWHTLADSDGKSGFFRENVDAPGNFAVDYSFSQNLKDHEEQIITTTITIAELVVDAYTGGASVEVFAAVNKFLFPFVRAMCSGDASELLNSTVLMAEDLAQRGITLASKDINASGPMKQLKDEAEKTYEFFVAVKNSAGQLVEGTGASMGKVVGRARELIVAAMPKRFDGSASTITDALDQGLFSGLPYGKQMLSAAHTLGGQAIGSGEKQFRALTDEVMGQVRSSAGVGAWAHDVGASIDFKSVVGAIPISKFSSESVQSALHDALEKAIKDYGAPAYCHEAIYTGAAWQVLLLTQKQELVSMGDVELREYKQLKTVFQKGFVPEQLKTVSGPSNASVAGLLAKPNPGVISGEMTVMSSRAMLAGNAGVSVSDIGPSKSDLFIAFGFSGLGLLLAKVLVAKIAGKNLPMWSVFVGAAGLTGAYAYSARNTIRSAPISSFTGLFPQSLLAAKVSQAEADSAARTTNSAPVVAVYQKSYGSGAGGASTGQSTKNLVLLQDGSHKFTVAEVQYLLGLWGSNPRPVINGIWSDDTVLAVRDYQTRAFQADKWFSLADVNGNPFDDKTSAQLRRFAKTLLTDASKRHNITVEEAQAILGLKITGVEDAATQARLKAAFMGPIASAATQAWLRNVALGSVAEFV